MEEMTFSLVWVESKASLTLWLWAFLMCVVNLWEMRNKEKKKEKKNKKIRLQPFCHSYCLREVFLFLRSLMGTRGCLSRMFLSHFPLALYSYSPFCWQFIQAESGNERTLPSPWLMVSSIELQLQVLISSLFHLFFVSWRLCCGN